MIIIIYGKLKDIYILRYLYILIKLTCRPYVALFRIHSVVHLWRNIHLRSHRGPHSQQIGLRLTLSDGDERRWQTEIDKFDCVTWFCGKHKVLSLDVSVAHVHWVDVVNCRKCLHKDFAGFLFCELLFVAHFFIQLLSAQIFLDQIYIIRVFIPFNQFDQVGMVQFRERFKFNEDVLLVVLIKLFLRDCFDRSRNSRFSMSSIVDLTIPAFSYFPANGIYIFDLLVKDLENSLLPVNFHALDLCFQVYWNQGLYENLWNSGL